MTAHPLQIVLVTGPSGAGRLTAVRCLEDLGFEAIDNLPLSLFERLLDGPPLSRPLALGIDVRNRDFSVPGLLQQLERLEQKGGHKVELLFLDCSADVLIRRFSETRRPHPLGPDDMPADGVAREIDLLAPVRERAGVLIDTSELTPHELRDEIGRWFGEADDTRLRVSVQSFSYKRGTPRGVDLIFDVRFLRNPHWEPGLRDLDGRDAAVADHVAGDPRFETFFGKVADLVEFLLPEFLKEGKSHLSIAFGCTGGQHRSVAVAERLANTLEELGWQVSKRHRELERGRATLATAAVTTSDGDRA